MELIWDETKRISNVEKHHLDFFDATELFQKPYVRRIDARKDYREARWIAYGLIRQRVCVCVYTERAGIIRIISLRKGNRREQAFYADCVHASLP